MLGRSLQKALADAGTIKVKLWFVENIQKDKSRKVARSLHNSILGAIPEKSIGATALSHTVTYDIPMLP